MTLDSRDWKSEKPQCRHHNDADNCYSCGTGRVSSAPTVFDAPRSHTPVYGGYQPAVCGEHNLLNPCWGCEIQAEATVGREVKRLNEIALINEINIPLFEAAERVEKLKDAARRAATALGSRCYHDKPALDCGLCRIAETDYNRDLYRSEINNAMTGIRQLRVGRTNQKLLPDGTHTWREKTFGDDQGLEDLTQLVDVEMLKATRLYGPKMNEKLAYTVTRNTIGKFQQRVIEEVSMLVGVQWAAMSPDFHSRAITLFDELGTVEKLEALSHDDRADKERRALAREIIVEYGLRRSRFESFDEPNVDENGAAVETSVVELEIHEKERVAATAAPDPAGLLEEHRDSLAALVASWRGDLRKVGEAVLAGPFTARGVPGVARSTASRRYQDVMTAFRKHIAKASPVSTIQAIEK